MGSGTSFDYVDYMLSLAEEYPDVTFINGSGYETAKNMSVYIAKLEQGRYMTGLLAGKMTKVNKIGYVSSIQVPTMISQPSLIYSLITRSQSAPPAMFSTL